VAPSANKLAVGEVVSLIVVEEAGEGADPPRPTKATLGPPERRLSWPLDVEVGGGGGVQCRRAAVTTATRKTTARRIPVATRM